MYLRLPKLTISVNDARIMAKNGWYGKCFECGNQMAENDLQANPLAIYCDDPNCEDAFRLEFPKLWIGFHIDKRRFEMNEVEKKLAILRLNYGETSRSPEKNERNDFRADLQWMERRLYSLNQELIALYSAKGNCEAGSYGMCEKCGEEIPAVRLKVVPWAINCPDCLKSMRVLH